MKRILNAAAIFFLAAVYCRAESQHAKVALEISGTIDRFFYRKSQLTNESLLFKMVVSGERWQIATTPAPQSSAYSETTCDGTNIFHFNKTNILSFDSKTRGLPRNCYWCRIDPGIIPSGGYSVQIPWLAYASSTLAQANLINIPAPWIDPRYYPRAHAYEAQVEAFTNPPYLPQSVNFRLSRVRADEARVNFMLDREDYKIDTQWKPKETYGSIGATYKVSAVTNIHGLTLPVSFEMTCFRHSGSRPVLAIYRGTNIVIKEIALDKVSPTVPDMPICVRDFRFSNRKLNISHIDYIVDTWINSDKADELQKLFTEKKKDHHLLLTYLSNKEKTSVGFYAFVAVALLLPFLFVFIVILNRSSQKRPPAT